MDEKLIVSDRRSEPKPDLSSLSAMAGCIDFILGVAGQCAVSAAIKAMFERDFLNVLI